MTQNLLQQQPRFPKGGKRGQFGSSSTETTRESSVSSKAEQVEFSLVSPPCPVPQLSIKKPLVWGSSRQPVPIVPVPLSIPLLRPPKSMKGKPRMSREERGPPQ